ncbi:MAG: response regulator, partial [Deltaproteobacteria bacterium]|nr:response regulator [Deltaproteobacteria bacterium]MBW2661317.1 response regulator [Deltaproteobacteria bacterium]
MNGLLFIDDEEGVRRSVVRALKKEQYKTFTVGNGEEGIKYVKENIHNISTVISDYKMPGLNGLETLSNIGVINPEITRIILTGYATMEAAILATNQGIDGFLTKPFDNIELRANIQNISVRKRLQQFISEQVYREIKNSPNALKPT